MIERGSTLLEGSDISKVFPGQVALNHAHIAVRSGEATALVGHNGSGKSTLIRILAGYYEPERVGAPSYLIDGRSVRFGDPDLVQRAGIRFIHQGLGLIDGLSVLENMRLGTHQYKAGRFWNIRWRVERAKVAEGLERLGLVDVSTEADVRSLTPVQRTGVAIARALQGDAATVVVLDEPTATMPGDEVQRLFAVLRDLMGRGLGLLYVSHRLEEIYEIASTVTVLREGEVVAEGPVNSIPRQALVATIVGHDKGVGAGRRRDRDQRRTSTRVMMRMDDIWAGELLGASLSVYAGEILGLAGLSGSGVHEIPKLLVGELRLTGGRVTIGSEERGRLTPSTMRRLRIAVLPSDRAKKGIPSMSMKENLTLADLRPFWRQLRFDHRGEIREVRRRIAEYDIRPRDPSRLFAQLSGGNQQKVCVAKWIRTQPEIFVLDEPTQGVDVGGKGEILNALRTMAASRNLAIVICSSDLEDLADICDRVVVFRNGRAVEELVGEEVTRERIMDRAYAA